MLHDCYAGSVDPWNTVLWLFTNDLRRCRTTGPRICRYGAEKRHSDFSVYGWEVNPAAFLSGRPKLATIEETARVGRLAAGELWAWLEEGTQDYTHRQPSSNVEAQPDWLSEGRIRTSIDADQLLKRGEHPLGVALRIIAKLQPGEVLRISSSFYPAPLIDVLRRGGLAVYSTDEERGVHATYIARVTSDSDPT